MISWILLACAGDPDSPPEERGPIPEVEAREPVLKRLTQAQYHNSVDDLFGPDLVLPSLEPDLEVDGLLAIGSATTTISPYGVEQYEGASFDIAEQVLADDARRAQVLACEPESLGDADCLDLVFSELGERVWRRPLTDEELAFHTDLVVTAGTTLEGTDAGLTFGIAALLQSPNFLYRVELGDGQAYSDWEMATRLSYFLWNTTPDDELLDAAAAGELTDDELLAEHVDRMLADERARQGVRNIFSDLWRLYELDDLTKDPNIFPHMTDEVGPSAREETLAGIEYLAFDTDEPYCNIFTTRRAFLDRTLAAIYEVPAPEREGFGMTELPPDEQRQGLTGQVSFLALQAHPVSTSVTRRGLFIRQDILCHVIPPPPSDVDTSIPETSTEAPTMRERVAQHLEDPACAACHEITDPIGLALENFDGIGRWRNDDNGYEIDATGDIDGVTYDDAEGLARVLAQHQDLGPCLTERVFSYANGQAVVPANSDLVDWHAEGFELDEQHLLGLLRDIALGPGFRHAGEVE
ncbi:MAG: DUF1592 domain-containing protein [Proteobacteria bacterium]|nr:DUF1592 domain-containing protein [Pseudomonadota bacterium]MCP4919080.1 DUF1592 domain-containing protein [Pseudomonadota bacterium]